MDTLSFASNERYEVSKSMRYSKVLDSMIAGTNYQTEGVAKEISPGLAKDID